MSTWKRVGAAVILLQLTTGCSEQVLGAGGDPSETCESLAAEAADIEADGTQLLKVRGLTVEEDNREADPRPAGADEAVLLSCTGAGVLDDGSSPDVRVAYTVDSDGDTFVSWEALQPEIDAAEMADDLLAQLRERPDVTPADLEGVSADCSSVVDDDPEPYDTCTLSSIAGSTEVTVLVDEAAGTWTFLLD